MNAAAGLKDRTDEGRLVQAHASTPGALSPWLAVLLVFFEGLAFSESPGYSSSPANFSAPVAQLDRVSGYEPEGRGFESCLAHQISALVRSNLIGVQYVKRAPVAQLDRVSGYEPEGRGFESCLAHHFIAKQTVGVFQASFLLSFENVQLFLSILLRRRRKEIHSPAKCLKFRQFSNQLISTKRKGFSSVFFKVMHRFCGQHALEETSRSARGSGR